MFKEWCFGIALAAAQAMVAAPVTAPSQAMHPVIVVNPSWDRRPSSGELGALLPRKVRTSGTAEIECGVTSKGSLSGCRALSENPSGSGLAAAALMAAPAFKLIPMTRDGQPVDGGSVRVSIYFRGDEVSATPFASDSGKSDS